MAGFSGSVFEDPESGHSVEVAGLSRKGDSAQKLFALGFQMLAV